MHQNANLHVFTTIIPKKMYYISLRRRNIILPANWFQAKEPNEKSSEMIKKTRMYKELNF